MNPNDTNSANHFYGNPGLNRKQDNSQRPVNTTGSAPKLFGYNQNGYNNNSANANGVANPYKTYDNNSNNYEKPVKSNGTLLTSDQGKDGDWFSPSPMQSHVTNPYSVPKTNSSFSTSNDPNSLNTLNNSTMYQSTSNERLPSNETNDAYTRSMQMAGAFSGPMQMTGAQSIDNNNLGNNSTNMTPIPGMEDYDNEPPLLEELGINLDHIRTKSFAVILPMKYAKKNIDSTIMEDDDLAGPLTFGSMLGGELLLAAKMNFGYIYGLSLFGCFGMTLVLNLLSPTDSISIWTVLSVLGYSLIPVNILAGVNVLYRIRLMGKVGVALAVLTIAWCVCSSTRLFERGCGLRDQRFLVAYPVALFYSAFVMLTIF